MNDKNDIKAVQAVRPDLDDKQADEVLSFLCDMYDIEPYTSENPALFKMAAELMYPVAA